MSSDSPSSSSLDIKAVQAPRQGDPANRSIESGLHVVASPIGNLGDITLRALDVLKGVDRIYAEDTRISRKLLGAHGIKTPLHSYHDHNGAHVRPGILAFMAGGGKAALISDAGTPLVSDPGLKLTQAALKADIAVTALPGACAAITALAVSGLPSNMFLVAGFPPSKTGPRRKLFRKLSALEATLIFYEGPSRLADSLADMREVFGNRQAVLARELTKKFEEVQRGDLDRMAAAIADNGPPRGEMTILIGPGSKRPGSRSGTDMVRRRRYRKGLRAENIAALWLMAKGYRIRARRFRAGGVGEIDLIAQKGNYLVFVEVKSRSGVREALEAITPVARKRLKRAAKVWMQRIPSEGVDCRFDAIAMRGLLPVRHVRNILNQE